MQKRQNGRESKDQEHKGFARRKADDSYDEYEEYDEYDKGIEYVYDDELARKRANLGFLIAFLVVLAIVGGVALYGILYITGEMNGKKATATGTVELNIASGSGGTIVGQQLKEAGLISDDNIFRFYVRFNDAGSSFQAGKHELTPGMSYAEIIEVLSEEPPPRETIRLTFPEGSTVPQFGAVFEKAGMFTKDEFVAAANDIEQYSDIEMFKHIEFDPDTYMKAEGYLRPETLEFYTDSTPEEAARTLFEWFDKQFDDELYARMDELNLTLKQVVTLASVVEEECSDPEEQPKVASVFVNRAIGDLSQTDLERHTLGSDATTRYISDWVSRGYGSGPEDFEGWTLENMKTRLLEIMPSEKFYAYYSGDNDPNTREALDMAGPISSPSNTAILAVLYPETSNNFYFLSNKYGEYRYAQYYSGHQANIDWMYATDAQYEAENPDGAAEDSGNTEG